MSQKNPDKQITKEKLFDLYITKNMTLIKISEETGISKTQLKRFLRKFEIKKERKAISKNISLSSPLMIEKDKLYDMYITQNLSVKQISELTGVSKSSVNRLRERYNIPKKDEETIKKTNIENTRASVREKYGVDSIMHTSSFREKSKKTMLDKYGKEHYSQTNSFKSRIKDIMSEKNSSVPIFNIYLDDDSFKKYVMLECSFASFSQIAPPLSDEPSLTKTI